VNISLFIAPSITHGASSRSLQHARDEIARWRDHYNTARPHSALGYMSPMEFLTTSAATAPETLAVSALSLNTQTQPGNSRSGRP